MRWLDIFQGHLWTRRSLQGDLHHMTFVHQTCERKVIVTDNTTIAAIPTLAWRLAQLHQPSGTVHYHYNFLQTIESLYFTPFYYCLLTWFVSSSPWPNIKISCQFSYPGQPGYL